MSQLENDIREHIAKCEKALHIINSSIEAAAWVPVPENSLILSYQAFVQACFRVSHQTADGDIQVNMDELAKELFKDVRHEPFEYQTLRDIAKEKASS